MSREIELKFEIDKSSIEQLASFFKTQIVKQQYALHLTNTYYDSKDNILRSHGSSVRIRGIHETGKPKQYEITVKSSGQAIAGLHARQEVNVSLSNSRLDLSVLPAKTFPHDIDVNELSLQLMPLFTTDFHRQIWLIHFKHSTIEVALDQGQISTAHSNSQILELELELKTGSQLDLLLFAIELSRFNVHLFSQSKAARGYRLLEDNQLTKISQLVMNDSLSLSVLPDILQYLQTNEEYALVNHDITLYQDTLYTVANSLKQILPSAQNEYSSKLNQIYSCWCEQSKSIANVKTFAYSEINTKFKLYLIWVLGS